MKNLCRIELVLFGIVACWGVAGCQKSPEPEKIRKDVEREIGLGQLNGKTYSNAYFNLEITFPPSWHIASKAENQEFQKAGRDMLGTPKSKEFDVAAARSLALVTASKFSPGAPTTASNCNFMIVAERVAHLPGVKTGADYLFHTQKTLQMMKNAQFTFGAIQHGHSIGSLNADYLPVEMRVSGQLIKQRFYATRVRDYILLVGMNYQADSDLQTMLGLLKTLKASK